MSDFEREAAKGIHSAFNACMYREQCRAAFSGTPMVTMDDGSSVHLDSYTGGAHEAGAWGELTIRFEHGGVATTRRYQEVAAPTPSAGSVPIKFAEYEAFNEAGRQVEGQMKGFRTLMNAAPPANPAPSEPVDWQHRCAALVDIYDDARNNAPEDRCYVDGAFTAEMDEVRTLLQANGATK